MKADSLWIIEFLNDMYSPAFWEPATWDSYGTRQSAREAMNAYKKTHCWRYRVVRYRRVKET